MISFLLFFVFIGKKNVFSAEKHPLHVALVTIEYNTKTKNFDVLFKIFVDDFEGVIARKYQVNLYSGSENENPDYSVYATKYVKEHFGLAFNGSKKFTNSVKFKEKDLNVEAVWLKFTITAPSKLNRVKVKASVLTDYFGDQTNLIVFKYKNFEEAFKLDNIVTENEFEIE